MSNSRFGRSTWGVLLLLLFAGCTPRERLDVEYGKTGGTPGAKSVNGTGVLAGMFSEAGNRVTTMSKFSPRFEKADTIVWAPNDFDPPSEKHRLYLENWLMAKNGRTVVYIGRDYDASVAYWRKAMPLAPIEQQAEFQSNLSKAAIEVTSQRMSIPAQDVYARWFTMKVGQPKQTVTTLQGPWSKGINAKKCEIELATRLAIPVQKDIPRGDEQPLADYELLLGTQTDPKVSQVTPIATRVTYVSWSDSQVIVVTNGSFLLNYPLVNKEHRKLAGKLIEECASQGETIFVESEAGGPPIQLKQADEPAKTGFEMLVVWPLGTILMHGIVCLLLACICLYPIFGRPLTLNRWTRRLYPSPKSAVDDDGITGDFGKHLDALGELLSLTKDQQFALDKLQYYQRHVKRESGVSHVGPPKTPPGMPPTTTRSPNP